MVTSTFTCRHCGSATDLVMADLGLSPVANDYVDPEAGPPEDPRYILKVVVCRDCRLAQSVHDPAADELFREDYAYFSSASESWLEHARSYVDQVTTRFNIGPGSHHVEIASNDGYLLQYSKAAGITALGVEPCLSVANAAIAKGIETRVSFFGRDLALGLAEEGWAADLVTANNVFAHIPDVNDFAAGIRELLKPQGVATIEVQHLLRLMQRKQFDTIYHEHYFYYSLLSAQRVLAAAGLRVFDVEELSTHGGSFRLFVCRAEADYEQSASVERLLDEERQFGLDEDAVYAAWSESLEETRTAFRELLLGLKSSGKSIAAYGAPAKGTTFLNFCGIGADVIDFTVDRAPSKQGKLIPGVRIPILAPAALATFKPNYVVILPWNLKDEIVPQVNSLAAWGVQFITAIPMPTIL